VACLIAVATVAVGAEQKNDPAGTLQRYLDAVNSADYDGLMAVVSDDLAPFTYAACTPQMSSKTCFGTFVTTTIFKRNGSLVSPSAKYNGDVISAVIEVRHDGTRAAHVPRMIGVDTITVKNNKIVSFNWKQDPNDAANKKWAAYSAALAAKAAPAAGAK
jgi:ketosteroid isomerase-like protein